MSKSYVIQDISVIGDKMSTNCLLMMTYFYIHMCFFQPASLSDRPFFVPGGFKKLKFLFSYLGKFREKAALHKALRRAREKGKPVQLISLNICQDKSTFDATDRYFLLYQ